MLKILVTTSEYGLPILAIHYPGETTLEFDLTDFYKNTTELFTLYDAINEYISTLNEYTQKEIYKEFLEVSLDEYRNNYRSQDYVIKLENKIARVSDLLNYNNFKMWVKSKESLLIIPENIRDDYIYDPDMNTTKEKTYIKDEYRDLIALILFIRALSPLYINFYNYIKQITTHYYYKLYMILVRSNIYTSQETEKLKSYIEANQITLIGNSKNENMIINAGLSDDDMLDSLVAEIIFNKLIAIDFFNKKCNIVSFIFQTIKYKGNFATSDSLTIRPKSLPNDSSKEDISYFEDYRKASNIPIGTVVEIQHSISDINKVISQLKYSNFNYDEYENELKNIGILMNTKLDKIQIYLLGWFISRIINPRILYYIENRKLIELLLLAKVILLNNGQEFIGTLLGSYKSIDNNYMNIVVKTTADKMLSKKLATYYKFNYVHESDKQFIIEKTISEVSKEICSKLWIPVGVNNKNASYVNKDGYLIIPSNINTLLIDYVEFINS